MNVSTRPRFKRLPTDEEISNIPLVAVAEFELSDKEMRQLRYHLYKVNHDQIRRFRTLKEGPFLLVWRIK